MRATVFAVVLVYFVINQFSNTLFCDSSESQKYKISDI